MEETINGASKKDILQGAIAANHISGKAGNDHLSGAAGNDVFIFDGDLKNNTDKIKDFVVADGTIYLENAVFSKLKTTGVLKAANFVEGAKAHDLNDYIIYNPATGVLSYDSDGIGADIGVQIVVLATNLTLTNADFIVV